MGIRLDAEVVVPLKYLSNFWRSFELRLINFEIDLNLSWSKNCVNSEISRAAAVTGDNPAEATLTTWATFQINNAKLCVPIVILSINNSTKFLEHLKQGLQRTISWNKYRSEITIQPIKQQFRLYDWSNF